MGPFDLEIVLITSAVPAAMLVVLAWVGRRLRRSIDPARRSRDPTVDDSPEDDSPAPVAIEAHPSRALQLHWLKVDDTPRTEPCPTAHVLEHAGAVTRRADGAFLAAGLTFTALLVAIDSQLADVALRDRLIFAFTRSLAPGYVTLAFVSWSWARRLVILAAYVLVGLLALVPIGGGLTRSFTVAAVWSPLALYIFPCLLLLTLRRLRPLLMPLAASFVFIAAGGLLAIPMTLLLGLLESEETVLEGIRTANPMFWLGGAWNAVAGAVLLQWLLRRPAAQRWVFGSIGFAACAIGVAFSAGPFRNNSLATYALAVTLIGPPVSTAQWFIVWLFFRLLVRIEEQRWLASQPLHFHLCCAVLALYVAAPFITRGQQFPVLLCLAALGVEVVVLHALLQRGRPRARLVPIRRLLLLRVFGQSDRREKLLDWLDDGWRRVGRVDLVAGTDLAMRTLGSRMLEAFLLRRSDTQYLKTAEDVERRLARMDSALQGDLRYPVNEVYCYESTWRVAVRRLAVDAHVVLFDLRGFSRANSGCVFELQLLIHEIPIDRILLLADESTDRLTVEETAKQAWASLPADSPNRHGDRSRLAILELQRRARTNRDALNQCLFQAAFSNAGAASMSAADAVPFSRPRPDPIKNHSKSWP